jgi:hypothetical protein
VLVSHRFRFIYTKTIKTAGTSVESYFERFCMPEGEWTPAHYRPEYVSSAGIIGFRGEGAPRRAGSTWWNHMPALAIKDLLGDDAWKAYFKFCVIRNPFEKAVSAFFFFNRGKASEDLSGPAQFEAWTETRRSLPIDRNKYLINRRTCMDDFIRVESLPVDMQRVCERLGVPWEPDRLPRIKAEFRPAWATVRHMYTPRSRERVARAYAFELRTFGYEFPA